MSAAGPTNFPVISLISRESNPVERIAPDRSRNRAAFTSPPPMPSGAKLEQGDKRRRSAADNRRAETLDHAPMAGDISDLIADNTLPAADVNNTPPPGGKSGISTTVLLIAALRIAIATVGTSGVLAKAMVGQRNAW
jgi:hypothetical protein